MQRHNLIFDSPFRNKAIDSHWAQLPNAVSVIARLDQLTATIWIAFVLTCMSTTITIPDTALCGIAQLKQEIALSLYRQSKLSLSQARRFADMDRTDFESLLFSRQIPIYDVDEFEKDLETLNFEDAS